MIQLKGNKILLRDWKTSDLETHFHYNNKHHKWMKYDGPYYPRTFLKNIYELDNIRQKILSNQFSSPRKKLLIADIKTDEMIGTCTWYWQSKETNWLSTGIVIYDENYWSQGIGYEAMGLYCQYLFDETPELLRIDMRSWSGNIGLMKLAEKLGFKLEAVFRKARIVKGKVYDGIGYGILREEWNELYPNGFLK